METLGFSIDSFSACYACRLSFIQARSHVRCFPVSTTIMVLGGEVVISASSNREQARSGRSVTKPPGGSSDKSGGKRSRTRLPPLDTHRALPADHSPHTDHSVAINTHASLQKVLVKPPTNLPITMVRPSSNCRRNHYDNQVNEAGNVNLNHLAVPGEMRLDHSSSPRHNVNFASSEDMVNNNHLPVETAATSNVYNIINSNNRYNFKVHTTDIGVGASRDTVKEIRLPLIINSVSVNGQNSGNRTGPSLPNKMVYFTAKAIKPSYEQIYDSIVTEDLDRLLKYVLDGFGCQIYSWRHANVASSPKIQQFMRSIPDYQSKIYSIHGAIATGESFGLLRNLLGRQVELLLSRDQFGATPLHKAVLYQRPDMIRGIANTIPATLESCDNRGRTPLHFAALLPDLGQIYRQLVDLGAMTTVTDMYLRRPEDYLQDWAGEEELNSFQSVLLTDKETKGYSNTVITVNSALHYFDDLGFESTEDSYNLDATYDRWWKHQPSAVKPPVGATSRHLEPPKLDPTRLTPPLPHKSTTHSTQSRNSTQALPAIDQSGNSCSARSPSPMNRINAKELIKQGNLIELEELVLQGYGDRLLGENSSAPLVQEFLDNLPNYLDQINELHKVAARGSVREFQSLLDRNSLISSRDPLGATPLHKAVLYGHHDLAEYIAANFGPDSLDIKDNDGRTALHYASALPDRSIYQMLLKYGAKANIGDQKNKTPDFYQRFPDELNLAHIMKRSQRLNANYAINLANRIKSKSPSKRKERSLSPSWNRFSHEMDNDIDPELVSNDGSVVSNASTVVKRSVGNTYTNGNSNNRQSPPVSHPIQKVEINSANLKRWIEETNIEMLEGVVLEGQGDRLRQKASTVLKDFDNNDSQSYIEETVPAMMSRIQNIHAAVSIGDLSCLQEGIEKKKDYILSKDHQGMTPLHKATIMGHVDVVQYILEKFPETVNARDREGRSALHYSTATTNRNGNKIYKMLVRAGADPRVRDVHGKSPDYYRVHLLSIPSETLRGSMGKSTNKTINSYQKTVGGLLGETNTRARRITQPGTREKINQALHSGNVAHLQELVLDGYGQELVGRTSFGEEARKYLKTIPQSLGTIRELQESVVNGDQATVQRILVDAPHFARARDSNSFTLMHLAVIGGHLPLVNYFVNNFASIINLKDNMNRTALHLAALTGNSDIYRRLIELSFDPRSMDQKGKTADHYLRNNPAISSNELQELLALGNGIAAPNGPQASTRLTRLSKATSKSNLANGTDSSITAGNTNGGLSPTSMKPSSKPVRLPALSRPAGQKDGAEQNGIKSDEESKEDEDQGEQKVARVNGSTVQEETRDQPEEMVEHTIEQSSGNITPLTEENEPQSREASAKEHVIIYSRNNGDQSPWTQIEDESVDLVVTQNETTEQTDANGDEAIQQIEQTDQVKTDETTNQLTNENDGDLDESTEQINLSPEANQVAPKAEDVSEQTTNSVDDASGEEKFDELQENTEEALTEKPKEERTSWSRGSVADTSGNPSETTVDVSENDLSKQFASSTAKEVEILENVEVAPSKEEDMKVVYGTDPPQEDNFQSTQRNWSADTTIRSKSDPQLDWEGRQSSANIRYVIAKSSNSADSALKKDNAPKDNKPAKKKASKDPVIINQEAIDETMKTMPQEKGPWPETITEENELKADSASNEEKLEQVMEKADEDTVGFSFDKPKDDRLNELIKHWLEDCDLLRLEHVVIAGQGDRLLNIKSEDRQVQDFLNLVPAYMEKIRNVHHAVTQGNLEEVQKVLTRKRFALCRDQFGGSPLHLAVMHGHTDIVIYIITQFPETIDGPDNDGRSPFHYAAVLPEKQIYQILDTAGASKAQKDRLGYTAPDYLTNGQLTIRDLLLKYTREPEKEADKPADLWERPPTAEIVSQLTPESGSVPSSANGKDEPNQQISEDLPETVQDSENNKSVQVLQIEPREHFNMSLEENGIEDQSAVDSSTETVKQNGEKSDDNSEEKQSVKPTSIGKKPLKRTETFDRSKKQTDKSPVDDKTFETMSNEFNQSLRSEKIRLQKSTDQQIKSSEVIKAGQNGSVIDSIQSAQSSNIKITNGTSASGYDLTQIKDEQGRTVLHLAAAKDQKRNTFYKMLQQAKYLIPERDAKYRTIRDVAVQNGIKNNLQVIDQFIIDCFIAEQADYLRTLMIEGYTNLLSVVDPEGNDVIAILKKNNIASMESVIHDMATLEKNRDELHTFIRNEYVEGVINLVENDPQLVVAKSDRGRTSLHLAVLFGNLDIIEALINTNHQVINIPDNLGRTPLHYAMAMSKMEEIGRILIHNNANKLIRDVRMRIPTYYFVYKQEIRDIKREEQNLTL